MKIILTGGAGFIGSCFLWKLNSMGIQDIFVVDTGPSPDTYPNLKKKKFNAYLTREELLTRLKAGQLNEVDGIIHLGACSDTTEMDRAFLAKNNLGYSQELCKWAIGKNKLFHYASAPSLSPN